ncbi:MAG: SulP family inorganic anion transporter [Caulobacteraceae bacterium]
MTANSGSPAAGSGMHPRGLRLFASLRGYKGAFVAPDLVAGLTLAAIAIPEQMATARLGALPPQLGFIAFIAASIAFAIFGASRQLSAGADSTITPIFAGSLALLATSGSPHYLALAAGLGLMVGILVAAAGILRMGWIGNLLSIPVTLGFLAGIAVHIVVSQLPAALGLAPLAGSTLSKIGQLIVLVSHANLLAVAVSGGVLALVLVCHRLSARLPGALAAVVVASLAAGAFQLSARGVALLGPVAGGLPHPAIPALNTGDLLHLAPLAFIVALVIMVQTAATTRSFPAEGGLPDEDGDFIGMGLANLLAGAVGAFPVDASPPRTAIVAESGGRSQVAGLVAAAVILALLLLGMGVLAGIPEAALSGILLFVAARIVRVGQIIQVIRSSPIESLLILATAAGLIVLPIEQGVALGIGLSLLHGLWAGERTRVRPRARIPGTSVWWPAAPSRGGETMPGVMVLAFQAPLTFLNAELFEREMMAVSAPGVSGAQLVVLEAAGIIDIDFTAAQSLKAVVAACKGAGVAFAVARLESVDAQNALTRLGLRDVIGQDHVFESVAAAIDALAPAAANRPA